MIRLERVSREYRTGAHVVHALREVDVAVERGEFVMLMGPSGSGKSTLLNVIGCLDRPTSGLYRLDGEEVTALPEPSLVRIRREKLGFVFQTFHLVPRLTALRNVELPMVFAGVPAREQRDRARRALDAVGLSPRATHRPDELSGGERQRVAIARALVMDPPVLLADEPTGNLDSVSGGEIVKLLGDLNRRGRTIVMVTHDEGIARVGHRRVRLRDGRIEPGEGP
ncbi:MAG: ABC transporter ATP-binding protein [Planctomycetales bacterium]|nr:ABC transporter ATP-binding protein [Planctomycetales bacterium]